MPPTAPTSPTLRREPGGLRVAVVGAGLAGLTAGYALRREAEAHGVDLHLQVFEAGAEPGGQLRTTREDGFLVDWGANAFRTGVGAVRDLVDALGLGSDRVVADRAANRRFIFHGGRLHAFPSGPASLLGFSPLSLVGRLRIAAEPFAARRVAEEESVLDYAARHLGREAAALLLGTMVRGVYGGDASQLSVDAAFPVMRAMERDHRSLVVAAIAGARERKRVGKTTWSFLHGMGSLPERLAEALGPAVRVRTPVLALSNSEGPDGRAYRLMLGDGREAVVDAVVVALPPGPAGDLLEGLDVVAASELRGIPTAPVAAVALGFRREAFRSPPDGYGFLVAPGEAPRILGALFESNLFPGRAPEGHVLVRTILGGVGRPEVAHADEAELVADARAALAAALGPVGEPEHVWVRRRAGAIPQYVLGHQARVGRAEARLRRYPGVHLAGAAYHGVAVGTIVEDAIGIARAIAGAARTRAVAQGVAAAPAVEAVARGA